MPLRELLNRIFDSADMIIVSGYSGSDHFDINAWIRDRLNARHKPRLIWIKHGDSVPDDEVDREKFEPHLSWKFACGGLRELHGSTSRHLADLLHQERPSESLASLVEEGTLSERLRALYVPTEDQRHLNGARLCIAVGMGQLAEEELRQFNHRKGDDEVEVALLPEVYARMGLLPEAQGMLDWLNRRGGSTSPLQRAKLFRRESRPFRSLMEIVRGLSHSGRRKLPAIEKIELQFEAIECLLDFVVAAQRFSLFRTKPLRRLLGGITNALRPSMRAIAATDISLAFEGKVEVLSLLWRVLFNDDDYLSSWQLLDEQYSPPGLILESGPAIPGFFLVGLSTCKEEDRLADVVEMKLTFVRILLSAIRRKWPKGKASQTDEMDWVGNILVDLLLRFLGVADQVARALDEPHLVVAVAKSLVNADQVLGGLPYWRRQRLYLGGR